MLTVSYIILGLYIYYTICPPARWLHPDDPLRELHGDMGPPAARTDAQSCTDAKESESSMHGWENKKNHPRYQSGINHWSPLSVLMLFSVVWDFCPDVMHIIKNFFEKLVLGTFTGSRRPKWSSSKCPEPTKVPEGATAAEKRNYIARKKKYDGHVADYKKSIVAFSECLFNENAQKIVDERVKNLIGYPDWIKTTLVRNLLKNSVYVEIILLNILGLQIDCKHLVVVLGF